jgi:hypothetical protein
MKNYQFELFIVIFILNPSNSSNFIFLDEKQSLLLNDPKSLNQIIFFLSEKITKKNLKECKIG